MDYLNEIRQHLSNITKKLKKKPEFSWKINFILGLYYYHKKDDDKIIEKKYLFAGFMG